MPIRAVSNAFGADIGYDRNTQTISVYDDFTEIVTAAYKLERTITICRGELDLYNESINANLFTINPATRNPDSEALISRNEKMLQTLQKENINYSLLEEELLPLYNEFIPAYNIEMQ